jgi:F-type H+-transporting ATPase subunit epsilon
MSKTFNLSIVAPDRVIAEKKAVSLVVPSELGYMGILANHAPLVANLTKGDITVRSESGAPEKFQSKGKGFIEVLNNEVVVILRSN